MDEKLPSKARQIMNKRFGRDTLIALATIEGNIPNGLLLSHGTRYEF